MSKKTRLAIVGTGRVANAHARAHLRSSDTVEVVALADLVPGKAEEFAALHGLSEARVYRHFEELLDDGDVEAVDVCLRPEGHGPASLAALSAGKHVFCEKPLAMSVAEARLMRDAALRTGLVTMVDFTFRYYPAAQFIRRLIDEGELGDVLRVRAEYLRDAVTPPAGDRPGYLLHRPDPGNPAANIVGDLGSHLIDLARFFAGEVSRVGGQYRLFGEHNESMIVAADFAGGAVGSLEATSVATGRGSNNRRVEVHGTKGAASLWYSRPSFVELYSVRGVTRHTRGFVTVPVPGVRPTEDDYEAWVQGMTNASRMFATAIQAGGKVKADFHDGFMSNVIMDAIFASSASGEVLSVSALAE